VAVQSHFFGVGPIVSWAEAGVGAVATQSLVEPAYGPRGLALMGEGKSAPAALDQLISDDEGEAVRQVAMVDSGGRVAVHTGMRCIAHAGHAIGEQVSAQANMMERDTVPRAMIDAYSRSSGQPLAERLLGTLEAAEGEGGDIRGRQSAAILIVKPKSTGKPWAGADRIFDLRVEDHAEPLTELRRLIRLQRAYIRANRGDELMSEQKVNEALEEYAAAATIAPEIVELPFWHAVTLASIGREAEAKPIFQAVFAKEPAWADLVPRLPAAGLLPDDKGLIDRIIALRR
jgi:uncharacterized Ntn-hydrolase superfamily protein